MRLIPAIDLRGGQLRAPAAGRFDAETVYGDDPLVILVALPASSARATCTSSTSTARATDRKATAPPSHDWPAPARTWRSRSAAASARATSRPACWTSACSASSSAASPSREPAEVQAWLSEFGPDRVVLAFDVRLDADGTPRLATHGWEAQTDASLWDAVEGYLPHGALHVLCTDVARDGALSGPNLALYAEAARRFPTIRGRPRAASAAAPTCVALQATAPPPVISGRALLEDRIPARSSPPFLPSA